MYRLFTLSTLILVSVCSPKRPRIYNVLISTKKNLSPSHAIPVYEPVLRTTSVGVAFPPLVYHNAPIQPNIQIPVLHGGPVIQEVQKSPVNLNQNVPANVQSLPVEYYRYTSPYIQPYYQQQNQRDIKSEPSYPLRGENRNIEENVEPNRNFGKYYENVNDPKRIIANLKKTPDIPDVPPPALPVKNL